MRKFAPWGNINNSLCLYCSESQPLQFIEIEIFACVSVDFDKNSGYMCRWHTLKNQRANPKTFILQSNFKSMQLNSNQFNQSLKWSHHLYENDLPRLKFLQIVISIETTLIKYPTKFIRLILLTDLNGKTSSATTHSK